jgi:hypothetical protein
VIVEAPPRHLPEQDRAGVLLAGWERFLGERLHVEGGDRLTFVDTLDTLTVDAAPEPLAVRGGWVGDEAPALRQAR